MNLLRICLLAAVVAMAGMNVSAQDRGDRGGRGNFDPEQFRQRMMERVREQMDVQDDADWKLISDRVNKVMEARREVGAAGAGAFFGRRPGGDQGDAGRRRGGPGGFGQPNPEAEALRKAVESKASADELKNKLAAYRAANKARQEKLEKAQDDLRKVLTLRQEAAAVMLNLLD